MVNWLNNLAQSNRQMSIDNDWAINLQVSHTMEIPRGFAKDDDLLVANVYKIPSSSFCSRGGINLNVPRPSYDVNVLNGDEEERLFGPVSDEDDDDDGEDGVGNEDYYDEDSSTCNDVLQNNVALQVLIDKEIKCSNKIVDSISLSIQITLLYTSSALCTLAMTQSAFGAISCRNCSIFSGIDPSTPDASTLNETSLSSFDWTCTSMYSLYFCTFRSLALFVALSMVTVTSMNV